MSSQLLIIRHAERPMIAKGEVGNELQLTKKGILETQQFARSVSGELNIIYSSPILRCMQTAQIIADIHAYPHQGIRSSQLLGDPGFFIDDAELAWQSWLNKGSQTVNEHLIGGNETWPGFRAFDQAIADMLTFMHSILSFYSSGIAICVTHDTILAILASRLLPEGLTMANWPDFLGTLHASYDSKGALLLSYLQNSHSAKPDSP